MAGLKPALGVLAVLATALAAVDLALGIDSGRAIPAGAGVLVPLVGVSFVAGGLVAWARRPANRVGLLMTATGFGWFAVGLGRSDAPLAFMLGLGAVYPTLALAAHAFLAFPAGRVGGRLERSVVGVAYGSAVVVCLLSVIGDVVRPRTFISRLLLSCGACPRIPVHVTESGAVHAAGTGLRYVVFAFALAAVAGVLVARSLRGPAPRRRAVRAVSLFAVPGLVLLFVVSLLAVTGGAPTGGDRVIGAAALASLGLTPLAMGAVMARGGFRAAEIEPVVKRLGQEDIGSDELSRLVRRAIGDPTAEIVYGDLTPPADGRVVSELHRDGRRVAAIVHTDWLGDADAAIGDLEGPLALAIENARLADERAAALEAVRESRERIARAGDAERRRIARDLHDGAQQRLLSLALQTRMLAGDDALEPPARDRLESLGDALDDAAGELRALVHGILPPTLARHGLAAAVREVADRLPLAVIVVDETDHTRFDGDVEQAAYFVAAEALANVVKHANAREARVVIARAGDVLLVTVEDDGVGGADYGAGAGLRGMADRAAALDGTVKVADRQHGAGTRVALSLPWIPASR